MVLVNQASSARRGTPGGLETSLEQVSLEVLPRQGEDVSILTHFRL